MHASVNLTGKVQKYTTMVGVGTCLHSKYMYTYTYNVLHANYTSSISDIVQSIVQSPLTDIVRHIVYKLSSRVRIYTFARLYILFG